MNELMEELMKKGLGCLMEKNRNELADQDEIYQKDCQAENEVWLQYENLDLPQEQKMIIDRYIDRSLTSNQRYADISYLAGIKATIGMLTSLGLIKSIPTKEHDKRTGKKQMMLMDRKDFADMVLKSTSNAGDSAEDKQEQAFKRLRSIATPEDNQSLLKIARENAPSLLTESENSLHKIYEKFADSREYEQIIGEHDFDIDWLSDILDEENYDKLEAYILYYCYRNDELLFHLGFKYALALLTECEKKED